MDTKSIKEYPPFNLDIPKIGYVIAFKYEKFNLFGESIYRRQLTAGFDEASAGYTHVEVSSGGPYSMRIMPPRARLIKNMHILYGGRFIKILRFTGPDFDNNSQYKTANRYKIAALHNGLSANLPYDILGVLAFIIPGIRQISGLPFCSEAITEAYQIFYPDLFDAALPGHIYPANFLDPKYFEVTWEGYIPRKKTAFHAFFHILFPAYLPAL